MGPDRAWNHEQLCWLGSAAIYWTGLDWTGLEWTKNDCAGEDQ
jgi:hypothetical protein